MRLLLALTAFTVHAADYPAYPAYTIYKTQKTTGYCTTATGKALLNKTVTARLISAQRRDGSTAEYLFIDPDSQLGGKRSDEATISDVGRRQFIQYAAFLNAKTTYAWDTAKIVMFLARNPTSESDCILLRSGGQAFGGSMNFVGREQVKGFDTVHYTREEHTDASGNHSITHWWLATALSCRIVKNVQTTTDAKGQVTSETAQEPDKILLGEPDGPLFEPKADELKPSDELNRRKQFFFGRDATDAERAQVAQQDAKYLAGQR